MYTIGGALILASSLEDEAAAADFDEKEAAAGW
jgi:hypothetical protein